ncbi:MAG TPA: MBOAT family protein [Pyrinomonadaceae bacterium]|nr:MBOAT family protein [Pyrinomonadaceae bacterium]
MLFTSGNYFVFLAAAFFIYWLLVAWRLPRIWLLLGASYYFYALWNPKFLALVFLISTIDFGNALCIDKARSRALRKILLGLSVAVDIGALFTFKYLNFFSSSLTDLLNKAGWHGSVPILNNLVLPLGLSFIAFRSLSYVIDVYRGTIEPTRRFFDYLTFVAFFPTIIAGPLARARDLLPQFRAQPYLSNEEGAQGLFLIMLGLVKKIAIAEFLANNLVDRVFDQPQLYSSVETFFAIYGYALQIYCDFSGYTDIAIGSALLLGFKLPANFNSPYRAMNLRDFWRRWHITLSNWLFDYVFVSLNRIRKRRINLYRNLILTFLIGGLWHGAAWTFVVWGALHGLGLSAHHAWEALRKRRRWKPLHSRWSRTLSTVATFHFVCLTWVVFRAESLSHTIEILKRLGAMQFAAGNLALPVLSILVAGYVAHWVPGNAFESIRRAWSWLPSPAQAVLIISVALGLYYVAGAEAQFIYGNF